MYLYGIEMRPRLRNLLISNSSNCTFMELKLFMHKRVCKMDVSSNCTFMELKSLSGKVDNGDLKSSNCTFMELKWHVE